VQPIAEQIPNTPAKVPANLAALAANNSLVASPNLLSLPQKSFAQEMKQLKESAAQTRTQDTKFPEAKLKTDTSNPQVSADAALAGGISNKQIEEAQFKAGQLRRNDLEKEKKQILSADKSKQLGDQEMAHKMSSSETLMATAVQDHQKTITEAVKEGNVAERESSNHQDANDRKRQLANWQDLAPRIIEDTKNRALRIDIPGIYDIETLIVRMTNANVSVQAVGSKDAMSLLQAREAELRTRLNAKNVGLTKLQVFDSEMVKRHT
jgi:predicted transposase YbfD/YdcC